MHMYMLYICLPSLNNIVFFSSSFSIEIKISLTQNASFTFFFHTKKLYSKYTLNK